MPETDEQVSARLNREEGDAHRRVNQLKRELAEAELAHNRARAVRTKHIVRLQVAAAQQRVRELEDQSARISIDNPTGAKR